MFGKLLCFTWFFLICKFCVHASSCLSGVGSIFVFEGPHYRFTVVWIEGSLTRFPQPTSQVGLTNQTLSFAMTSSVVLTTPARSTMLHTTYRSIQQSPKHNSSCTLKRIQKLRFHCHMEIMCQTSATMTAGIHWRFSSMASLTTAGHHGPTTQRISS